MSAAIGPEVVDKMRELIAPLDTPERRARYLARDFPRAETVKDLDRRYRWDLLWESGAATCFREVNLAGFKNSHIDTALRSIVKELTP